MFQETSKRLYSVILFTLIVILTASVANAAPVRQTTVCAEEYTAQAGDWLSKISDKFLGDVAAYPAIVGATNQQHASDDSFANIVNPDLIEVGWKICIPNAETAQALLAETTADSGTSSSAITITDALGRTITFDQPPQRMVIAGRAASLIANAFYLFPEADEKLVALEARSQNENFLPVVSPNYQDKILLDRNAGPEQIAPAKPDVVILKTFMAESLGESLELLGIPVVYIELESPEQYARDIVILGQLFNDNERAVEITNYYEQQVNQIEEKMAGLTDAEKPRILLLQYSDTGGEVAFKVPPASWIQTTLANTSGGVPIWIEAAQGGGWTVVNFEQIAAWDADQIYIINYFGSVDEVVARLKDNPQWAALRAVKDGQLFGFAKDYYSWDQPDTRWGLGLLWLAAKIQPAQTEDIDIMKEFNRFYSEMYGLSEAAIEQKITPMLGGDIP